MQHLYWRNTKESIKNEYELPPLIEDLVLLNFTPLEAFIYRDCRNNYDIGMHPPPSPPLLHLLSSPPRSSPSLSPHPLAAEQTQVCSSAARTSTVYSALFRSDSSTLTPAPSITNTTVHDKLIEHVKVKRGREGERERGSGSERREGGERGRGEEEQRRVGEEQKLIIGAGKDTQLSWENRGAQSGYQKTRQNRKATKHQTTTTSAKSSRAGGGVREEDQYRHATQSKAGAAETIS